MIYSCMGMVWGVDWIHLVWVGVSIKKARGVFGLEKMHIYTILAIQRGQGQGLRDWVR